MIEVSVVIAAYNAEATIADALRSIQNQTFSDWEIIVVDDASTDRTKDFVQPFLTDPRIRLITTAMNSGAGRARNIAMAEASSALIAVMDADDISLPQRIELQVAEFKQDPELVVLSAQLAEFGLWGGPQISRWPVALQDIEHRIQREKMPVAHCASMFRKERALEAGGYDEACLRAEDFALFRKLSQHKFACLDSVQLLYRTTRPIRLKYAIASGRHGRLARVRTRTWQPRANAQVQRFPMSALTDLRSALTWARRRRSERRREIK